MESPLSSAGSCGADPLPERLARLIAPLRPGVPFQAGWTLASAHLGHEARLEFAHGQLRPLRLVLLPRDDAAPAFARTGHCNIVVKGRDGKHPIVATLIRSLAALMERNERAGAPGLWDEVGEAAGYARSTVDLQISTACQNRCVFCTDRPVIIQYRPTEDIKRWLGELYDQGYRAIDFGAMEPTLRKDFLELVSHAYDIGFAEVRMITNGYRTSDPDYAREVADRGVTLVTLSIHSPDRDTERTITGRDDAFTVKTASLRNFEALRAARRAAGAPWPRLATNTVICRQNLPVLADLCRMLDGFPVVEQQRYYLVQPQGNGLTNAEWVLPSLEELRGPVSDLARVARSARARVRIMDVPLCVLDDPLVWARGPKDIRTIWEGLGFDGVNTDDKGTFKSFGPPCEECVARPRCGGVWTGHVLTHGWEGIRPIRG